MTKKPRNTSTENTGRARRLTVDANLKAGEVRAVADAAAETAKETFGGGDWNHWGAEYANERY